jgi:hypothetical protein
LSRCPSIPLTEVCGDAAIALLDAYVEMGLESRSTAHAVPAPRLTEQVEKCARRWRTDEVQAYQSREQLWIRKHRGGIEFSPDLQPELVTAQDATRIIEALRPETSADDFRRIGGRPAQRRLDGPRGDCGFAVKELQLASGARVRGNRQLYDAFITKFRETDLSKTTA